MENKQHESLIQLRADIREDPDNPFLYTVVCGYEYEPIDLLHALIGPIEGWGQPGVPQVVAGGVELHKAQHILRTLTENGEPDMCYWMLPNQMWTFLVANAVPDLG